MPFILTDEIDTRIDIDTILAALPPQQRRAARLCMEGFTQQEIASRLGTTQQAISWIFTQILVKVPGFSLIDNEGLCIEPVSVENES